MYRIEYGKKRKKGKDAGRIFAGILALLLGFGIQRVSIKCNGQKLEALIQNFSAGDSVKNAVESFCQDMIFIEKDSCS